MQRKTQTKERQRPKHHGIQRREKAFLLRAMGRLPEQGHFRRPLKDTISTGGLGSGRKGQQARQKKAVSSWGREPRGLVLSLVLSCAQ